MGSLSSKDAPPPSAPPLFEQPWRQINWKNKQEALECVKEYKPQTEGQRLRILLHGPVGAGKSSFINSVLSVLRGRMCVEALADNTSDECFTKAYQTYDIPKGSLGSFYPFVFNDILGLSADQGVCPDDIGLAFKGHVMEGYRFNPESKLCPDDQFYNKAPTDNDKVSVLVCVVPADTLSLVKDEVKKKIRDVRLEASRLGIPQVAVLTKVDEVCPEVQRDLRNVYRSKRLKKAMKQISADSGIPMNCIFPVKNYHEEISLSDDVDALILSVLTNIIHFGDDFINRKLNNV